MTLQFERYDQTLNWLEFSDKRYRKKSVERVPQCFVTGISLLSRTILKFAS
jgi:hypothetical protein